MQHVKFFPTVIISTAQHNTAHQQSNDCVRVCFIVYKNSRQSATFSILGNSLQQRFVFHLLVRYWYFHSYYNLCKKTNKKMQFIIMSFQILHVTFVITLTSFWKKFISTAIVSTSNLQKSDSMLTEFILCWIQIMVNNFISLFSVKF